MKRLLLLIPAVLAVSMLTAPAAHATAGNICTVSQVTTYSPPVTNTPQTITITNSGSLFACTNSSASTGTYRLSGTIPGVTCSNVLASASGALEIDWTNPGTQPSTFTFSETATKVNGNIVLTALGEIAAGTFTPDPAQSVLTFPQLDLTACSGTGVTTQTGLGTLTIGI